MFLSFFPILDNKENESILYSIIFGIPTVSSFLLQQYRDMDERLLSKNL